MFRALRLIFLLFLSVLLVAAAAAGWWWLRNPDPVYSAYETVFRERFHRYDSIIEEVAGRHGVDPMIVKAVVWRESRFRPGKVGGEGERGLMQITEAAAREWTKGEKVADFAPKDLFDPKTNIEAGTWLLARALHRYVGKDDPLPFALAEYNAGRSRVVRWTGERESGHDSGQPTPGVSSQELEAKIDIADTRAYIRTVQNRVQFYHQRGRL